MGASGSKKKKNKGGFLGELADAAEGATSSLTKTIEGTSNQVTAKIDTTTKSVTEAIDSTSKRLSGTAQSVTAGVTKTADEAAGNVNAVTDSLKESAEATSKNIQDSSQKAIDDMNKKIQSGIDDTKDKAQKAADSVKVQADQAQKKSEEIASNISGQIKDVKDSAEESAANLKNAAESKAAEAKKKANEAKDNLEKQALDAKANLEKQANDAKDKANEAKSNLEKQALDAKANLEKQASDAKDKANEAKSNLEKQALDAKANLEKQANDALSKANEAKSNLEKQALDAKANLEKQANEAKDKANEAKANMEKQALDAKANLEKQASNAKDKANEAKSNLEKQALEAKANMEKQANEAQEELESLAAGLKDSAVESIDAKKSEAESQANQFKGNLENTFTGIKKDAEGKISEVKGSAQQVSDNINKSITDAKSQGEAAKANLTDLAESTTGLLKDAASNMTNTLQSTVTGVVGGAVTLATEAATKTVQQVGSSVKGATDDVTKSLTGAVQSVSSSVTGVAGAAASGLMGKAGALSGAWAQGAADVSNAANRMSKNLEDDLEDQLEDVKEVDSGPDNRIAFDVCKEGDMKDGEMKVFKLNEEGSVLIVKENGVFSALGTKCSHYGAPLAKGVLHNGKVRCPWHGACFKTSSGDIEESPGLDSIPCYQVKVEDGQVKVLAQEGALKHHILTKNLCKRNKDDQRVFVIIGGGGAGEACAETLRQQKYTGRLVLICKESDLPYDRPKLSKALTSSGKDIILRSEEYFNEGDIEVLLDHEVVSVDTSNKLVKCANGFEINYDSLMIATGGKPTALDVPGNDLENVCYLRTPAEANAIVAAAKDKKAVIIGTSFIGMEVAAYLHGKAKSVTVVGRSKTPFAFVFGEKVGERLTKLFIDKGVEFQFITQVSEFKGEGGKLQSVVLQNGEVLEADVCIVGIGVGPSTDFLSDSGLKQNEKKFLIVDEFMKTSIDGVYAGGDIVQFPLSTYAGDQHNCGHWQMAQTHGRTAAFNMLGKNRPLHTVPFFWASMFGKSLRYSGNCPAVKDYIIDGDLEAMKFVVYCCDDVNVVAVAAMGMDPIASQFASFIAEGGTLTKAEIESNPKEWLAKMSC